MKQKTLLFTATAAFLLVTLMSNLTGPANMGNGNRTGGPGSTGNCSTSGCHSVPSAATTGAIELRTKAGGPSSAIVTSYTGGQSYIVTIRCAHATLNHFGFQIEALLDASATNAGTFSAIPSTKAHQKTIAGKNLIEHATVLAATGGVDTVSFEWAAPAAGAGTVTFYGIVNAVNNNASESGDIPSLPILTAITESSASVNSIANDIAVAVYPNPASTFVHVSLDNAQAGDYNLFVYDMQGRMMYNNAVKVNGSLDTYINMEKWANGLYQVQLLKGDFQKMIPVLKQQ